MARIPRFTYRSVYDRVIATIHSLNECVYRPDPLLPTILPTTFQHYAMKRYYDSYDVQYKMIFANPSLAETLRQGISDESTEKYLIVTKMRR